MNKGLVTSSLGSVCPITNRKPKPFVGLRDYYSTGAVGPEGELSEPEPVDFENRPSRAGCMPESGDIGFARMKGTKKVVLINDSLCGSLFSTGFCFIAPGRQVMPQFAFYYITSEEFQNAKDRAAGDGIMGGIKNSDVESIEIPVPTLVEQERIVAVMNKAFVGLSTAQANTGRSLQNARALLQGALDAAVAGKLTREWRCNHGETESAHEKLERRLADRRNQWTGAGRYRAPDRPVIRKPINLPERWVVASPEQITTHIVDCPHSTPKWSESGALCLRTTNFRPGFLDLSAVRCVSEQTYKERIKRLEPKPGDVLYSREGGILGIACMIPEGVKACLGQRMMLFRADTALVMPEYLTAVLNSTSVLMEVKRLTSGAASPHLNICDIRTFPIPLPPIDEQRQIVAQLDAISAETQRLASIYEKKLAALVELKKSLLHQAFSGQL